MENMYEVHAAMLAEEAEDAPTSRVDRLPNGFQLVTEHLPNGNAYLAPVYGQRELELFEKGRADLMGFALIEDGAYTYPVVSVRTCFGLKHYTIGEDGVDVCVTVRPITETRSEVKEYTPRGYRTSYNPEAVDKFTGFLKSDYAGGQYKTIVLRMLESEGTAFDSVEGPKNSYEQGVYDMGASCNWGGYKRLRVRAQLVEYLQLEKAGKILPMIDGLHVLEFIGKMAHKSRGPVANFVVIAKGDTTYQTQAMTSLTRVSGTTAFVDGGMALNAWLRIQREHKAEVAAGTVGIKIQFRKEGNL